MLYTDKNPTLFDIINLYGDVENFRWYPIFDESKRDWLNERIIEHFLYREIAQDTPAAFWFFLNRKMLEIMPTYNPIFKLLNEQNDLNKLNSTEQLNEAFDFPQNQLAENGDYATSASKMTVTNVLNSAELAQSWILGVNNALEMLFSDLETLFIQIF